MEEEKVKTGSSIWPVFSNWMRSKFIFSRPNNSGNWAFTLIEILIVVALIGVLSAAFIILINPKAQLQKARDSQRKSHLRQIQSALEVYRADCGAYPVPTSNSLGASLTASCNGPLVTYMQTVPVDPKTKNSYYYCTTSCPGAPASALYSIYACIENTLDPESLPNSDNPNPSTPPLPLNCSSGTTKFIRYSNP